MSYRSGNVVGMDGYQPGDLRPTGRGQQVEVVAPERCSNGHPLGPNKVTVGYTPCDCGKDGTGGHNTWRCLTCDDEIVGDGCTVRR
jgi:hypothetical protein